MTNFDHFWYFLIILTTETIKTIFDNFDNWKDSPGDLWHLRHWLQFWQLRTWIQTIIVTWQLIVTLDSIRNSCDVLKFAPYFAVEKRFEISFLLKMYTYKCIHMMNDVGFDKDIDVNVFVKHPLNIASFRKVNIAHP